MQCRTESAGGPGEDLWWPGENERVALETNAAQGRKPKPVSALPNRLAECELNFLPGLLEVARHDARRPPVMGRLITVNGGSG